MDSELGSSLEKKEHGKLFKFFFLAAPTACRSSQARDQTLTITVNHTGNARPPRIPKQFDLFFFCEKVSALDSENLSDQGRK